MFLAKIWFFLISLVAAVALTIALVSPVVSTAATAPAAQLGDGKAVVLRLTSLKPTLSLLEAPGSEPLPMTMVREEVVNRPAYQAYLREKDCLATAIYFEARGETAKGQKAVAEVVLHQHRADLGRRGVAMSRYKGLGEMNAEELRETTLDPANRTLLQVRMEDVSSADDLFRVLMGDQVEPRREFIQKHALDVRNLDV